VKYGYYADPRSSTRFHVLDIGKNRWHGVITLTGDDKWESENSRLFDTPEEAADDNGPARSPELIASVNCSRCDYPFTLPVNSNDLSISGNCPKCGTSVAGHAIPISFASD
jgi:hypothetical protein